MSRMDTENHSAPYTNGQQRWAAIVAHRRAGKTVACINDLIALRCRQPPQAAPAPLRIPRPHLYPGQRCRLVVFEALHCRHSPAWNSARSISRSPSPAAKPSGFTAPTIMTECEAYILTAWLSTNQRISIRERGLKSFARPLPIMADGPFSSALPAAETGSTHSSPRARKTLTTGWY